MAGVTKRDAEKVLKLAAAWLGKHGWTEDGSPTPTGPEAAYHGLGPVLQKRDDWGMGECWTVMLEGGPYEWAVESCWDIQQQLNERGLALFIEPGWSFSLCIYKK